MLKNILLMIFAVVLVAGCAEFKQPSLWEAAEQGNLEVVKQYLADGADVNAKVERVWMEASPLHYAVHGGAVGVVEYLIEVGADVNALGESTPLGKSVTPLDMALSDEGSGDVKSARESIVEILRNHDGMRASDLGADK